MTTRDAPKSGEPIAFDDLPKFSRWPAVLLGTEPFRVKQRTPEEVLREYDRDKFGKVLAWLKTDPPVTEQNLLIQQGIDPNGIIPIAWGAEYRAATVQEATDAFDRLVLESISGQEADALVELGCGLGNRLLRMAEAIKPRAIYGGEFTESGMNCGRLLAKQRNVTAQFDYFDYYTPATCAGIPKNAVVYTSHSIEQIPKLPASFIEALLARSPRLVAHLEPCYEEQDPGSLLGLMRRRYWEINDYNRNLLSLLQSFEQTRRIRILTYRKSIFSYTPFNPTSILTWCPA
jgi:hypothetical protein